MNYEELLEKAREIYESEDTPHVFKAWLLANIIGPADESEDEQIRKELIEQICYIPPQQNELTEYLDTLPCYEERIERYRAWLEKQGEKKMVNADKVIGWLNHRELGSCDVITTVIPDDSPTSNPHRVKWLSDEFIEKFKKDFGLC